MPDHAYTDIPCNNNPWLWISNTRLMLLFQIRNFNGTLLSVGFTVMIRHARHYKCEYEQRKWSNRIIIARLMAVGMQSEIQELGFCRTDFTDIASHTCITNVTSIIRRLIVSRGCTQRNRAFCLFSFRIGAKLIFRQWFAWWTLHRNAYRNNSNLGQGW